MGYEFDKRKPARLTRLRTSWYIQMNNILRSEKGCELIFLQLSTEIGDVKRRLIVLRYILKSTVHSYIVWRGLTELMNLAFTGLESIIRVISRFLN